MSMNIPTPKPESTKVYAVRYDTDDGTARLTLKKENDKAVIIVSIEIKSFDLDLLEEITGSLTDMIVRADQINAPQLEQPDDETP